MHDDITRQLLLHNKTLMWPRGYNALPPERLQASPSDHMAMPGTPGPRTGRIRPNSVRLTADIGTRSTRTGRIRPQDNTLLISVAWVIWKERDNAVFQLPAANLAEGGEDLVHSGANSEHSDISRVESFAFLFSQFNSGCQIVLTLQKKKKT